MSGWAHSIVVVRRSAGGRRHDVGGVALGELERRHDPVDHGVARLVDDARLLEGRQVGLERSVADRRLGAVQLDDQVVELERGGRGEQVLDGLDRAGRITQRGAPLGGADLREPRRHLRRAGQVHPAEDDPLPRLPRPRTGR